MKRGLRLGVGELAIHRLSPDRLPDFLAFFDSDAFRDNPEWGTCYCQCFLEDHTRINWAARSGADNRALACARISVGAMQGFLAYDEDTAVGWCNAAPRVLFHALDDEPAPREGKIATILCFLVHPDRRGQGVARALLDGVCVQLRRDGITLIEANPRPDAEGDGANHFGPVSLYRNAGFRLRRTDADGSIWMEKAL